MDNRPGDEELRRFIEAMLSNLDKQLREPEVIDEALREHRDMWTKLYQVASGFDVVDEASP